MGVLLPWLSNRGIMYTCIFSNVFRIVPISLRPLTSGKMGEVWQFLLVNNRTVGIPVSRVVPTAKSQKVPTHSFTFCTHNGNMRSGLSIRSPVHNTENWKPKSYFVVFWVHPSFLRLLWKDVDLWAHHSEAHFTSFSMVSMPCNSF